MKLRTRPSLLPSALLLFVVGPAVGAAPPASRPVRLQVTSAPVLVDCAPVTLGPCMSAGITPVDSAGNPSPVTLPAPQQLAAAVTLHSEASELKPFFASAGLGPDAAQHANVALFLVDISGSMNQPAPGSPSRFAAVRTALSQYLQGMQDGTDRVAIVPFESHNVVPTLRAAVYATTKTDALAELNALPQPAPKNNTALFQAVFTGVQSLQDELASLEREGRSPSELQAHLVVLTDGRNEVLPGDDPQLLTGDLGLQQAALQVQTSHLDVIAIGFGDRAAIDQNALQRLSSRFIFAADASQLLDALHTARSASSHEIRFTWLLPSENRLTLMGRDPVWTPQLTLSGYNTLLGDPIRRVGPALGAPVYDRKATAPELQALIALHPPTDAGWSIVLLYSLLTLSAAVLLTVLWFWVPRLVWGDRYQQAHPRPRRWASDRSGITSATGVQIRPSTLPNGFGTPATAGGPVERSAAQTTQVQPRGEFSRTRLTFEQK